MRVLPSMMRQILRAILEKPNTRRYPYISIMVPAGFRGKPIHDPLRCMSCGLCARDCPAAAIEMVESRMTPGHRMPSFNLDRCVFCFQCAESCPRSAIVPSALFELASTKKERLTVRP
jgi:NADH-quinone oxidoreductase subunit I